MRIDFKIVHNIKNVIINQKTIPGWTGRGGGRWRVFGLFTVVNKDARGITSTRKMSQIKI